MKKEKWAGGILLAVLFSVVFLGVVFNTFSLVIPKDMGGGIYEVVRFNGYQTMELRGGIQVLALCINSQYILAISNPDLDRFVRGIKWGERIVLRGGPASTGIYTISFMKYDNKEYGSRLTGIMAWYTGEKEVHL